MINYKFNNDVTKSICHRIMEITEEGFKTKGDKNNKPDAYIITEKEFVGKVIFKTNIFVDYSKAISKPLGFYLYLIFPIVIFMFMCILWKISKRYRKKIKDEKQKLKEQDNK